MLPGNIYETAGSILDCDTFAHVEKTVRMHTLVYLEYRGFAGMRAYDQMHQQVLMIVWSDDA